MSTLTFGILGPLAVVRDGQSCRVGRTKSRQVLATLLLHPNQFVSTDLLTDVLWGEEAPRSAAANIRTYVHSLRGVLGDREPVPIETHTSGYSINLPPDALDSSQFQTLVAEATRRARDGDQATALATLERAYGLWRGHPLDDLPVAPAWQLMLGRLDHLRRQMLDDLVELWMATGRHRAATAVLTERLAEDPYSEPLWCRHIACLAALGRTDEARAAAQEIRQLMADELGLEPGPELRELTAQLGGPDTGRPLPRLRPRTHSEQPAPSQLPLATSDFTGRRRQLAALRDALCAGGTDRPAVTVISGPPGAGKTAFAVHLGHLVRDAFPDGQIFLDMRATTQPRDPSGALVELLRGFGIADAAIPSELDRKAAMLRSELASRRALIVLDDAASTRQVTPLIPGTGSSAVLITSRQRLTDMAGVSHQLLWEFDDAEAAQLLYRIAGDDRVRPGTADAQAILRACDNLPLAIRIAGSRLQARRDLSAADLAARLLDERQRLDELRVGDLAVRPTADLSYRMLSGPDARMYRVLGLLGVTEIPAWLLTESGIFEHPERSIDILVEANLAQIKRKDRDTVCYQVHDLLRCHALELAMREAPGEARADLEAMLNAFLARSAQQAGLLPSRHFGVLPDGNPPTGTSGGPSSVPWFDAHRPLLTAAVRTAAHHRLDDIAWRLAATWIPYVDLCAHYDDWHETHTVALPCAQRLASRRGEAILLRNIGQLALYRDEYDTAQRALRQSYDLFGELGDRAGSGVAAAGVGTYHRVVEEFPQALEWYQVSLECFQRVGDLQGEAVARNGIAGIWLLRKEPAEAAPWLATALDLACAIGDEHRVAQVRRRIASLREQEGDGDAAIRELRSALDIFTAIDDHHCASYVQRSLGELLSQRGELAAAHRMLVLSLNAGHRLGDRRAEAMAARQLGQLHRAMGRADSARQYFRRADRTWQLTATATATG